MKKRLLALILAGLLTASFASCVAEDIDTGDGSTVDLGSESGNPGDDETPSDEYEDVDLTLFTISDADLLTATDDSAETLTTIPAESEVHCTKRNAYWCYISYNGQEGYIARRRVTSIDILGKNFTPVDGGEKIMYVSTAVVNVRRYPSSELEASEVIVELAKGTAVTVISTNDEWSRIKYQTEEGTKYYFVFSEYLSEDKQTNPEDPSQWLHLFVDCDPYLTLYTNGQVNLRSAPSADAELIKTISTGSKVTVKAQATINEMGWSHVSVEIQPDKVGDAPTYLEGYMATSYLVPGASTSSLDEILATYPGITKRETETTMYAAEGINVRSTPDFTPDDNNKVGTLQKLDQVTVVAGGTHNGVSCYVIKFTVNEQEGYYFVFASYLTIYEDGTKMLTLDIIRSDYTKFTVLETPRTTQIMELVNCYLTPENSENSVTQLYAGTTVEVVAEETGSINNSWLVIRTADGSLYFVAKAKVN